VAFLATGVLSLFFLTHGPRLVRSATEQIRDPARRLVVVEIGGVAYERTWRYAMGRVLMAAASGLLGYLLAAMADVPGAAVLGLWCALWDLVPLLGFVIGSVPIVVLASVQEGERGVAVALAVIAYQCFEAFVLQRRVERTSIHLGPFLTVLGALLGLELYGLGGALLAVALLAGLVAVAEVMEERREAAP
jgi:predicted PurR-regulated permease PerM